MEQRNGEDIDDVDYGIKNSKTGGDLLVYDEGAYKDIGQLETEISPNVQIGEIGEESPQHRQKVQSIPSSKKSNTRSAYNSEP